MRIPIFILALLLSPSAKAGEILVRQGQSLHNALRQAREWRRTGDSRAEGGITIRLMPGRHYMKEPLFIRPEDSGSPASPTTIRGEQGAVVCGDPRQGHTQLWPQEGMLPLLDFNAEDRTVTVPALPDSLTLASAPMEMLIHQRWAIAILRVKDITACGDAAVVTFQEPESRLEFEHPWPQPVIGGERGNSRFLLRTTEQRLGIERLVVVCGTEETPVSNICFENITFENTCWNRPLLQGHITLQGGFPIIDAYKLRQEGLPWAPRLENQAWIERPVAAVCVGHASKIDFKGCRFQHLGATALDLTTGIDSCMVADCLFYDIGGTAIMAGSFAESPREVHRPYGHLASQCRHVAILRNTIRDTANEDWGAVPIGCGYVSHVSITHNDVSHTNYSGICVGWGWTPAHTGMEGNLIAHNKVSDYARQLYDAGGIYTLSNQPHSAIRNNDISQPYPAPYATNSRAFCIYLDAETDGYTISNNTTEGRPIDRRDIGDNHPGPDILIVEEQDKSKPTK